jgi:hypothetical protein
VGFPGAVRPGWAADCTSGDPRPLRQQSGALAITPLDRVVQKTVDRYSESLRRAIGAASRGRSIRPSAGARDEGRVAHQSTHPQARLMKPALERRLADAGDLGCLAGGESLDVPKH